MRAASGARQPVLGLALELGLADEDREHGGGGAEHVVGRDLADALVAGELAIAAQALVSAARKPASCVPPSGVGMVLQ